MYYIQNIRPWFGIRRLGKQITVKMQDREGQNKEEEEGGGVEGEEEKKEEEEEEEEEPPFRSMYR